MEGVCTSMSNSRLGTFVSGFLVNSGFLSGSSPTTSVALPRKNCRGLRSLIVYTCAGSHDQVCVVVERYESNAEVSWHSRNASVMMLDATCTTVSAI